MAQASSRSATPGSRQFEILKQLRERGCHRPRGRGEETRGMADSCGRGVRCVLRSALWHRIPSALGAKPLLPSCVLSGPLGTRARNHIAAATLSFLNMQFAFRGLVELPFLLGAIRDRIIKVITCLWSCNFFRAFSL